MRRVVIALALGLVVVAGCRKRVEEERLEEPALLTGTPESILPIPTSAPDVDPKLRDLGRKLFADPRLSADGTVSCASCHKLEHGGADDRPFSTGVHGRHPPVNTPSIFDAGLRHSYGWYGVVHDLGDEIDADLAADDRMGNDAATAAARLAKIPEYVDAFREARGRDVDADTLRVALVDYVKSLVAANAPIDAYVSAPPDDEARDKIIRWPDGGLGFVEFKSFGCANCHQGMNVGANVTAKASFDDARAFTDLIEDRDTDPLRFVATHLADDRHVLLVPSLRNVACTAPYFHDGSAATLEEAVEREAEAQLGHPINHEQVVDISAFLRKLTGTYEGKPL